jgi:predicted phosphodiesterase
LKHETHVLIQALKECAVDLGHPPSKREFTNWGKGPHHSVVVERFKSWSAGIIAAGMTPNEQTQKKNKDKPPSFQLIDEPAEIEKTIGVISQRKIIQLNDYKKIACIPDMHLPFINKDALSLAYAIIEREKPDIVVQLGDLIDGYSNSGFSKTMNLYTPRAEWELAFQMANDFWKTIRNINPKAECFQLLGNHDIRHHKRIIEKWPEGEHMLEDITKKSFTFEGVTTILSPREELFIGDIAFIHGHYSGMGKHRDYMRCNVVHGHDHNQYVVYKPVWDQNLLSRTIWEMSCGLLGDPFSAALSYRPTRIHNWVTGMGMIDTYGPRPIAF